MAQQGIRNGPIYPQTVRPLQLNGVRSSSSSRDSSPGPGRGYVAQPHGNTLPPPSSEKQLLELTPKMEQLTTLDQPSPYLKNNAHSVASSGLRTFAPQSSPATTNSFRNVPLTNSASVPSGNATNTRISYPQSAVNQYPGGYQSNVNQSANKNFMAPNFNSQCSFQQVPPQKLVATQPFQPGPTNFSNYQTNRFQHSPSLPNTNLPPKSLPANYLQNYPATSVSQQVPQPTYNNYGAYNPPQQYPNQNSNVVSSGYNKMWGTESVDLLQTPNILPPTRAEPPIVNLGQETLTQINCSPEIFCCTMTKIPETNSLLQKSRLPLGVLIHPFKDLSYLPVIQCNVIVRCRSCRTYINPFVYFVDAKRWKCNLCYRINELPEEFQYDPVSKTYGDPSRRPEIKSSTLEYIAPAEYMLRPPQPAIYLFLLDVSRLAVESGYLEILCNVLLEELKNLPGDSRTQIGFLAYDSSLHFFSLTEGLSQPNEMTVLDIDDAFLPRPDGLLVNLKDKMEMVEDLLRLIPVKYKNTFDNNSCLGAALQIAHKMVGSTGGRVTVFQASLPNIGPGALTAREDVNQRSSIEVQHLNPANDYYKRLALECSGQQIAVDLFIVNSQYVDVATVSGISRFSGGCIHHFPLFKSSKSLQVDSFQKTLRRYLTRKIGFEAVMRVRCTRGLSVHTFHGNFFVRSTDLLSLPNINPDAGFGMQVAIEESLTDVQTVCFQAALLYTSSKGERRIRVHTLCLPVASTLNEIIHSADQQCIIGLLSKMAVDRSMQSSLADAREAFINAAIDILSIYKSSLNMSSSMSSLMAPNCLKLLPLYISAILKHTAFRIGVSTRLDDRLKAMIDMKTKPLYLLMQSIYPDLYPIHNIEHEVVLGSGEDCIPAPPRLQLTARCISSNGVFLMDCGDQMIVLVGGKIDPEFIRKVFDISDFGLIPEQMYDIPMFNNATSQRLHHFINALNDEKPYPATLQVVREDSPDRTVFFERLIEDRMQNSLSYHEFLQHLKTQVK